MSRILSSLFAILFSGGFSHAGLIVIGDLARTASLQPGDPFEGVIFIRNTGAAPVDATVSQTDYSFRFDGSNDYGEPGKLPRSNADWITLTPLRLKLGAGETMPVRYKGAVPPNPKLSGTYWSMIMVEPNGTPPITPEGKADQIAVGLQTTIRFAIQIVTEIGQGGTRSLQILNKRLVKNEGSRVFELDVANDGERLLIPSVVIELFDQTGASAGRFDAGRTRIYPGCSVRARADLSKVPPGQYAAMVLLDSGEAQVMGAQYELEIQSDKNSIEQAPLAKKDND